MGEPAIYEAACPHPDCEATLKVNGALPEGEYDCKCKGCKVRLGWATYMQGGRKPYLTLVTDRQER